MLTPVDQPLDKLDDLKSDEMCVLLCFAYQGHVPKYNFFSDNMKGL
jgi:hypothetical protein